SFLGLVGGPPGDGVVGEHAPRGDSARLDESPVDLTAVAVVAAVARRGLQAADELRLDHAAAEIAQVLDGHRGVLEDLHGLEPGQLVEEPAARGVHEHAVALHLEQPPHLHVRGVVERRALMTPQPGVQPLGRPIEHDVDVAVAGLPRILQPRRGAGLVEEIDLVAEPIERLAQRRPPALLPVAAHTAATVPAPALDTMGAAQRRGLADLGLEPRWVGGEDAAGDRARRMRQAWWGARIVNFTPASANTSSDSSSAAVSGNHMPSGSRPNR